jgi:hypothetical protein
MTTAYLLTARGFYSGQTATLSEGQPRPANAVLIPPPDTIPLGKKAVWVNGWEIIDDPGEPPKDMVPKMLTVVGLMTLLGAPGPGGMTLSEINATLADTDFIGFLKVAEERLISRTSSQLVGPTGFFASLISKGRITSGEVQAVLAAWPMENAL